MTPLYTRRPPNARNFVHGGVDVDRPSMLALSAAHYDQDGDSGGDAVNRRHATLRGVAV